MGSRTSKSRQNSDVPKRNGGVLREALVENPRGPGGQVEPVLTISQ